MERALEMDIGHDDGYTSASMGRPLKASSYRSVRGLGWGGLRHRHTSVQLFLLLLLLT
jgi:hypothetical protein